MEDAPSWASFQEWFSRHGAYLHKDAQFIQSTFGWGIGTLADLPSDTRILSVPFDMLITVNVASLALRSISEISEVDLQAWSERQLICSYLVAHWIFLGEGSQELLEPPAVPFDSLRHGPYLAVLPRKEELTTSTFFTDDEMAAIKGTNLYGATIEQTETWEREWNVCSRTLGSSSQQWSQGYTLSRYLVASTYLSSRAFPSSLLQEPPSLSAKDSAPVLVPLLDTINHRANARVTWSIDTLETGPRALSLILHSSYNAGSEVFNNYGPKPNASLLLSYGFVIPENPHDTMLLKLPNEGERFEVGLGATGQVVDLFQAVERAMEATMEDDLEELDRVELVEFHLEVVDELRSMIEALQAKFPQIPVQGENIRDHIRSMIDVYVQGQIHCTTGLVEWCEKKADALYEEALQLGVDLRG